MSLHRFSWREEAYRASQLQIWQCRFHLLDGQRFVGLFLALFDTAYIGLGSSWLVLHGHGISPALLCEKSVLLLIIVEWDPPYTAG